MSLRGAHTKTFGIVAALFLFLVVPQSVSAQAVNTAQSFVAGATWFTSLFVTIFNFLTWFMLSILDHIMDPRFIFARNSAQGTDIFPILREIWQFTRDLVNLGFAMALIFGAVMMIVTADGKWITEHLKKFVIALVLVNFSWFIPRVIFDFSQVLTYTIYQIPSLLGTDGCTVPPTATQPRRPCDVVLDFRFFRDNTQFIDTATGINNQPGQAPSRGWRCPLPPLVCIQTVPIDQADAQVRTSTKVLDGLVVNHARLQWLAQIIPTEAEAQLPPGITFVDAVPRLLGIVVKLVVVLILHIALLVPLIAMVAAFFIRIPVLWVSMAFMPLIALGFAFPKLKEGDGKALFWDWQEHFLKAVFLPAKVAIPFVIGFIMLNAGAQLPVPDGFGSNPLLPIFSGISNMWQILWMCIALFIIWKYSFEQLSSEKAGFMGSLTDKIKSIGGSLGSVAAQIPLSVPFIPVPGRPGQTFSIGQGLRGIDPRLIRDELRLGRFGSIENRMGLQPPRPDAAITKELQTPQNIQRIEQINTTNFNTAITNADPKVQAQQLDLAFRNIRSNISSLSTLQESQIIDALAAANQINPDRAKQLRDLLQRLGRSTSTAMPPAPAS